jgi:hypothetical protein
MSSIQEREAELAALQSAFDEYITSSRELEEELDAELAKMRKFACVLQYQHPLLQYQPRSNGHLPNMSCIISV